MTEDSDFLNLFAFHFPDQFDFPKILYEPTPINVFPLKDSDPSIFVERSVITNFIEVVRWERGNPIICEAKSSYGPGFPSENKVSISVTQLKKLTALGEAGFGCSLIFQLGLPSPKFVEIPIEELHIPAFSDEYISMLRETVPILQPRHELDLSKLTLLDLADLSNSPLVRFSRYYFERNLRIPAKFRKPEAFTPYPAFIYNYSSYETLLVELRKKVPNHLLPKL